MKASLSFSVLILAGFAAFGWRQHSAFNRLHQEQSALRAEAAALGLWVDEAPNGQASRPRHASRPRLDRAPQNAKAVAGHVIHLLNQDGKSEEAGQSWVERISGIWERLGQLDAAQVRALLHEIRDSPDINNDGRRCLADMAILALAETHPEAAIVVFDEAQDLLASQDGKCRRDVLRKLLGSWAATDPLAAVDWMRKHHTLDPDARDPLTTRALIAGVARKDQVLACQLVGEWAGGGKLEAVGEIVRTARTPEAQREMLTLLRGMGDETGEEWFGLMFWTLMATDGMSLPDHSAYGTLAHGMIEQGYAATQTWLVSAKPELDIRIILADELATSKPTDDTGRWLEWMGGKMGLDKTTALMSRWTSEDYRAASNWLATTPDGAVKHAAAAGYAATVAPYDPATAARWAETLPADANRGALLQKIHAEWQRQNPDAAGAFAAKHGIRP